MIYCLTDTGQIDKEGTLGTKPTFPGIDWMIVSLYIVLEWSNYLVNVSWELQTDHDYST